MSRQCLVLLMAIAAVLWTAPPAAAGTYQVYSCRTPANMAAPTDGWEGISGHAVGFTNGCGATNQNLVVRSQDRRENAGVYEGARYSAPADTTFTRVSLWRYSKVTQIDSDGGAYWAAWLGVGSDAPAGAFELCGYSCPGKGQVPGGAPVEANRLETGALNDAHELYVVAGCVGSAGLGCNVQHDNVGNPSGYAKVETMAVQAELRDDLAPTFETPVGSLAAGGVHAGLQSLDFAAADKGGGLYHTIVETKRPGAQWAQSLRQVVDDNGGRCQQLDYLTDTDREFGFRVPCKLSVSETVGFDTTTLADGVYQLRVLLEDVAGNTVTVLPEREFEIDNVPPPAVGVAPGITGSPKVGAELQGVRGSWSGQDVRYAYQWLRCTGQEASSCLPIPGATSERRATTADDLGRLVRFSVTATNAEGAATAASEALGPITDASGAVPACADGLDNDNDGKTDTDDPQCASRAGTSEAPAPAASGGGGAGGGNGGGGGSGDTGGGGAASPTANGVNASSNARLTVSGPASRTIAFRRSGSARITLRDEGGRAISGATIQVLQRMTVPGQAFIAVHSPVTTDSDGHVRYLIEPGYSRTLRFAYAPTLGGTASIVRDVRVTVPSRTTLRTNRAFLRNGQSVRFLGHVLSTPVPGAGVVIDLQARIGNRWQTFNSLRSNDAGRWHASYRFRSTTGVQTYAFRARVRGDTGFPYAPSRSRTVRVRVTG